MKITDMGSLNKVIDNFSHIERRQEADRSFSFKSELTGINQRNAYQKLCDISDAVTRQGAILSKRADIAELKRYKEMVSEFMYEAVKYSYDFDKENTMDARGRHRIYATIKKVNTKLDDLTAELLSEQSDNLNIMASIDEVRGLLLDLFT